MCLNEVVDLEGEFTVADRPMVRQRPAKFPFAAALLASVIEAVPVLPPARASLARRSVARPDDLRIGPDEGVGAPALLLHAVTTVEQLVIAPAVSDDQGGALGGRGHGCVGRNKAERSALSSRRMRPGQIPILHGAATSSRPGPDPSACKGGVRLISPRDQPPDSLSIGVINSPNGRLTFLEKLKCS